MAKDHGPTVKNDKQYEGLREKGMSKSRAAAISNSPETSSTGGKSSGTQCHEMTSRARCTVRRECAVKIILWPWARHVDHRSPEILA